MACLLYDVTFLLTAIRPSAGSVGLYAIQLAHLAGYKVVTVASPRNHALLKSLGADAVFDVSEHMKDLFQFTHAL